MIADNIKNRGIYSGVSARLAKALDYLAATDFTKLEVGRYEVDGDNIYALVQNPTSKTRADAKYEGHKRYIDIQYIFEGEEIIYVEPAQGLEVTKEYNPEKDGMKFADNGKGSAVVLRAGDFAVLYPHEAHMPCVCVTSPAPERKVVVKVKL
jgi:biofilm protein TabA